jgi:hypothetical protein
MKRPLLFTAVLVLAMFTAAAAVAQAPGSGIVAYWRLDEGAGTVASDTVAASHGTITNPDWSTNCQSGSCLQSAPRGHTYVWVPDSPELSTVGSQLTVEAWIYPFGRNYLEGQGNCGFVLYKEGEYALCVGGWWQNGTFGFYTKTSGGDKWLDVPTVDPVSGAVRYPANQWYHLTGVYDGATMKIYVNGVEEGVTTPQSGTFADTPGALWLGHPCVGADQCYYGKLDEVAVYNRALSAAEVQQHYQFGIDPVPPTASPVQSPAANDAGWNATDVVVTWNWTDNATGIDLANCTTSSSVQNEGESILTATCQDRKGNIGNATYTVKIDKTKPTLAPIVSPNPVLLNGTASVISGAQDALSGLATQGCGVLDTTSVGAKSVTCSASDVAGNVASVAVGYQVVYNFAGFFPPVDSPPIQNVVKAGSSIPVKFSLAGNQGLSIFAPGFPASRQTLCDSGAPVSEIDQTVAAGDSSLSYDPATDQYTYVWKTDKHWANTCRLLVLELVDGTQQLAYFRFR